MYIRTIIALTSFMDKEKSKKKKKIQEISNALKACILKKIHEHNKWYNLFFCKWKYTRKMKAIYKCGFMANKLPIVISLLDGTLWPLVSSLTKKAEVQYEINWIFYRSHSFILDQASYLLLDFTFQLSFYLVGSFALHSISSISTLQVCNK